MNFELTDDHLSVQKLTREFAAKTIAPGLRERDRENRFDRNILTKMAESDILGICLPEKYGGAGMDYISLGLACEELEYIDTSARVILSVHIGLNSLTLLSWGNQFQKEKYLTPQAKGEKIASFGLTEPNAGSDVVGIQTTAVKRGDRYILNGEKMWISLADIADHFLVFGWTDIVKKNKRDHTGISAFIVERPFAGVTTGSIHGKLGVRAGNTGWVAMQDVEVPAENLVGNEGEGFKIAMFCLEQGRYTVAAGSAGLIRACLDACVTYSHTRKAFEVPIAEHQLVKEMIAGMEAGFQISRLLWLKAGWMRNVGLRATRETALAKWIACEQAEKAAADSVQVHGAYGFSDEYPVERFYRNAKGASIYEGTREIQKLMQADYALGFRADRPRRVNLPPWPFGDGV
ncbi:MAG: butyryl-CoA dehydrogenase [candidate division Zixibacteria bacterium RBG_16_53_22]|nr:MAG: butyryl-CoA dehydrogenase [candidate division Zixibacteria bacterium RBG_16_53_22]